MPNDPIRVLSGPALRAFFAISEKWGLSPDDQRNLLGSPPPETFNFLQGSEVDAVSADILERISYVLGIYKALHTLFSDKAQADNWPKKTNNAKLFNGQSALTYMLSDSCNGLERVHSYLKSQILQ